MGRKEFFIGSLALLAAIEAARYAFASSTRKEIGIRDEWTCQGLYNQPCIWEVFNGEPAKTKSGYYLTAAHYPHLHGKHNENKDAGRILCIVDHATEELLRGNKWGAGKLLSSGVYSWSAIECGVRQLYYSTGDLEKYVEYMKPHFEKYMRATV